MSVSLSKGQSVSLVKKNNSYSNISINLQWNQGKVSSGIFGSLFGSKKDSAIDLDLGCLYELQDGTRSCVQALGNLFGNLNSAPFIKLDGDDRTGESENGETLVINGNHWDKIKRVLVFAYIYEGTAAWANADGVVYLSSESEKFSLVLDNNNVKQKMCGIALIENVNGEMKVTKVNEYFNGHRELDAAFNWNLNWTQGRK